MNYREIPIKAEICEIDEYLEYKNEKDILLNYRVGIEQLNNVKPVKMEHVTLFCGGMAGFDGEIIKFINAYARERKKQGENTFLLSEVTAEFRRYTKNISRVPFICTPHLLAKDIVVQGIQIHIPKYVCGLINNKGYLQEAIEIMKARYPGLGKGYPEVWGYYAYNYIELLLNKVRPEKVVLWNQHYPFHHIFDFVCRERNVPVSYMEYGCLPGTIQIEETDEKGKKGVLKKAGDIRMLKINKEELIRTQHVLQYLRESGLNRYVQPGRPFVCDRFPMFKEGRPNVLFCGQNDFESELFPYTKAVKKKCSPCFQSSIEAMQFFVCLAIKNEWNLFLKPHPIMKSLGFGGEKKEELASFLAEGDINNMIDCMDVVVTIFSQTSYIALIRKKPVVMLGKSQLCGKKCTYDAYKKKEIEGQVKKALNKGLTKKQKNNFIRHCAGLMKYCLYDDLQEKPFRLGKSINGIKKERKENKLLFF